MKTSNKLLQKLLKQKLTEEDKELESLKILESLHKFLSIEIIKDLSESQKTTLRQIIEKGSSKEINAFLTLEIKDFDKYIEQKILEFEKLLLDKFKE